MAWRRRRKRAKLPSEPTATARKIRLPYPKDDQGRALCRWCRNLVPDGRVSWCDDACVIEYKARWDNRYQRRMVLKRDRGVCLKCSLDTLKVMRAARAALKSGRSAAVLVLEENGYRASDLKVRRGRVRTLWQADHPLPVVEGGGGAHWSELRTLCLPCHRAETAALMKRRRAEARASRGR